MSAIGSEMYTGINVRTIEEQQVAELALWALCGDAPTEVVPDEYAHFKQTALEFVASYLTNIGVAATIIRSGIAHAQSHYERSLLLTLV